MKNLNLFKVFGAIVLIVIIVFGVKYGLTKEKTKTSTTNESSYYAVFLTNNQVYFGHLSNSTDQYLSLTDIYYLQLAQPLQSTDAKDITTLEDNSKQQLTLTKLGKELHGPKDKMTINRDNVLFFEELNNDSKVVEQIMKDKQSQTK